MGRPAPVSLYAGPRTDGKLRPWREGGTGGDSSSPTQPAALPYFLEGGTPNVLGVAGLAAGIAWVAERGPDSLRQHEVELLQQVVDWVKIPKAGRSPAAGTPRPMSEHFRSIVPGGLCAQDLGAILDTSFDIAVRPGLHCAPYIHRALGTFPDGTLRLSPGPFTTRDDIAAFIRRALRDYRGRRLKASHRFAQSGRSIPPVALLMSLRHWGTVILDRMSNQMLCLLNLAFDFWLPLPALFALNLSYFLTSCFYSRLR